MDIVNMVIEQTIDYKKRMKYDPKVNEFIETEWDSLAFFKNVPYPYGWLKDYRTPPDKHLDILLISEGKYELGEIITVRIIGVFIRIDGDNKLVSVLPERFETDYSQLPTEEKEMLSRLYPGKYEGEGWFGLKQAEEIIQNF